MLTTAAYLSSEFILVPVRPEFLSTIGLPLLAHSITDFSEKYGVSQLTVSGIVFNAVICHSPQEEKVKEAIKKVAEQNKWHIFSNEINYSIFYPRNAIEGRALFRTSYARTEQAQQFEAFAEEFAKRIF